MMFQNSPTLMIFSEFNFRNLYETDQNLLDSQISWDFTYNILKISKKYVRKVRNIFEKG